MTNAFVICGYASYKWLPFYSALKYKKDKFHGMHAREIPSMEIWNGARRSYSSERRRSISH